MEGFTILFFMLTKVGINWVSALGIDEGGNKKVSHVSDPEGYEARWEEIKRSIDVRDLRFLLSPVRGLYMRRDEARLLTVYVGKTDRKVHGFYYLPMWEDEDCLPQSFHHYAFIMNRTDGDSVTGYL